MNELAVRTNGHLTISPDQTFWTEDQALVLQQTGIDKDVTRAELTGFLHLSQRTGLDPFSRQIYLIGRYDSRAGRKVYTPQTGIDGYRIVGQRTAERTGTPLSYDDTLWCGEDGVWHDVWLLAEPPRAAKVTVYRGTSRFSAVATYAEYVQTKKGDEPTAMWKRMPAVMLAKCAESLALRKAFPHDLAGVYTTEEMGQADNPRGEQQQERRAERQSPDGPIPDQWSTPAPVGGVEDAEVVEDVLPAAGPSMASKGQRANLVMAFSEKGITDRAERLVHAASLLGREVPSFTTLTVAEYNTVRKALRGGWPYIDPGQGAGPAPGEYGPPAEPGPLEDNPVRDVLTDLIANAGTFAQLAEAGRDIAAELARGNITRVEADVLRAVWKQRQAALSELEAAHQEEAGLMAMAGAEAAA